MTQALTYTPSRLRLLFRIIGYIAFGAVICCPAMFGGPRYSVFFIIHMVATANISPPVIKHVQFIVSEVTVGVAGKQKMTAKTMM